MGEPLAAWMVLVPIAALLTPFVVLPRFAALRDRQEVRVAGAIGIVAVLFIVNSAPVTSYTRTAVGGEAIRLIPLLQFDSALLATTWAPDQLLIGFTDLLLMAVIFSRNLRNAFWYSFVLFGIGIEINQALGIQTQDVFAQNKYKTILKKDLFENDRMILALPNQ